MIALITGASAGIGKEFATEFAKDKIDLILVARREENMLNHASFLETTYGVNVTVIPTDLAVPNSAEKLYDEIQKRDIKIDFLINNAGFGDHGEFVDSDLAKQEEMINLNILTLTKLTRLFGVDMKLRNQGTILNVASDAAFRPGPMMSVYFATKHYVLAFSEAIAEELRPYGVYVCTLCPGSTQSEFGEMAGFGKLDPNSSNPTSAKVAAFGFRQMKKKKVVFIHGRQIKLKAFLTRVMPKGLVRRWVYSQMT
jgi:short-subunit dehydrogenase